jgi:FAD/FMN-containing dehydrogenase
MDGLPISQLPRASGVNPNDLVVIVQGGVTKSATVAELAAAIKKHIDPAGML